MVLVELVGGPQDGKILIVPGDEPPMQLRVVCPPDGRILMWHPAAKGLPDMVDVEMVILDLDHRPPQPGRPQWLYLWPRVDHPEHHLHSD